jgi:hypothetical protein
MNKVIKNDMVAVLYSPGFGAGWYTWHGLEQLVFEPKIVEMVEAGRQEEIDKKWIRENFGLLEHAYYGGAKDLEIRWVPVGKRFMIKEYDGSESVILEDDLNFLTA